MALCSHETTIEVEDKNDGTVSVHIKSSCNHVKEYAKLLTEVKLDDLYEMKGSKILELATEARLTPTCLVPVGVFNACWLEVGMISKNLVKTRPSVCIHFME
ncbi:MAG: hypothetical protein QHH00_02755 [Methanomassiliicoccales archaeon]|jgi:hypothetical protein|nr:hypothetical protein [Methanomassiliicoccales archaeon]